MYLAESCDEPLQRCPSFSFYHNLQCVITPLAGMMTLEVWSSNHVSKMKYVYIYTYIHTYIHTYILAADGQERQTLLVDADCYGPIIGTKTFRLISYCVFLYFYVLGIRNRVVKPCRLAGEKKIK